MYGEGGKGFWDSTDKHLPHSPCPYRSIFLDDDILHCHLWVLSLSAHNHNAFVFFWALTKVLSILRQGRGSNTYHRSGRREYSTKELASQHIADPILNPLLPLLLSCCVSTILDDDTLTIHAATYSIFFYSCNNSATVLLLHASVDKLPLMLLRQSCRRVCNLYVTVLVLLQNGGFCNGCITERCLHNSRKVS